jgi:hypothetical protein
MRVPLKLDFTAWEGCRALVLARWCLAFLSVEIVVTLLYLLEPTIY